MKLLLLHPQIHPHHPLVENFTQKKISFLFPSDTTEAWEMLQIHEKSIDLAILNLENTNGDLKATLQLIQNIKTDPLQSDLPIIITTTTWSSKECEQHQAGPYAANAYWQGPITPEGLYPLIEQVLGTRLEETSVNKPPAPENLSFSLIPPTQPPRPTSISPPQQTQDPQSELEHEDLKIEEEIPYLFQPSKKPAPSFLFSEPLDNAVVPGGAAQPPDLETFKKYLLLREQDVAVLSHQLKSAQEQIQRLEKAIREEHAQNMDLQYRVNEQKQQIDHFNSAKQHSTDQQDAMIDELQFQIKAKTDQVKFLEHQEQERALEVEQIKERVRIDIRKIRTREKELENSLEIIKKDSEALITARESKIIELKRKLDLIEFNMDLVQERAHRDKESLLKLKERLNKATQALRVAQGLLELNTELSNTLPSSEVQTTPHETSPSSS